MMTEEEIRKHIEALEQQRLTLLSQVNATEGAIAAYRSVLDPSVLTPQPATATPRPA